MKNGKIKISLISLLSVFYLAGGISFADTVVAEQMETEQNSKAVMQNLQKAVVRNNEVVFVIISQKELTRFFFERDKIKHIYTISGELSYDLVDENLYLKPNIIKPINFFVTTEKGKTYQVLAEPRDIPATQVMVVGAENVRKKAGNKSLALVSQASIYVQEGKESLVHDGMSSDSILMREIRKIVLAIKSNDRTLDYKIKEIDREKSKRGDIVQYIESCWSNEDIIAEKQRLTNATGKSITLNKANYLTEDIIAVYLDESVVAPNTSALLILLRRAR